MTDVGNQIKHMRTHTCPQSSTTLHTFRTLIIAIMIALTISLVGNNIPISEPFSNQFVGHNVAPASQPPSPRQESWKYVKATALRSVPPTLPHQTISPNSCTIQRHEVLWPWQQARGGRTIERQLLLDEKIDKPRPCFAL